MFEIFKSSMELALPAISVVLTVVFGPVFVSAVVAPAVELKKEIGKVGYSLYYYANKRRSVSAEISEKTRSIHRAHAGRIVELTHVVRWFPVWKLFLGIPSQENLFKSVTLLTRHSNFSENPDGVEYDCADKIRDVLGIRSL